VRTSAARIPNRFSAHSGADGNIGPARRRCPSASDKLNAVGAFLVTAVYLNDAGRHQFFGFETAPREQSGQTDSCDYGAVLEAVWLGARIAFPACSSDLQEKRWTSPRRWRAGETQIGGGARTPKFGPESCSSPRFCRQQHAWHGAEMDCTAPDFAQLWGRLFVDFEWLGRGPLQFQARGEAAVRPAAPGGRPMRKIRFYCIHWPRARPRPCFGPVLSPNGAPQNGAGSPEKGLGRLLCAMDRLN